MGGLTHLLVLALVSVLSEGCCQETQDSSGVKHPPRGHYRVVQGDPFVMACVDPWREGVVWSRSRSRAEGEDPAPLPWESVVSRGNLLKIPAMMAELSGNYSCRTASGKVLDLHLLVLEKTRLGCSELGPTQVTLTQNTGDELFCPPSSCGDPEPSDTQVTWYKDGRAISELRGSRGFCGVGSRLVLCNVQPTDSAVFSCDRHQPLWTTRRALNVTVIPPDTTMTPTVLVPNDYRTEEVVIGEPHTLLCEVKFGFERTFAPVVQWYSSSSGDRGQMVLIGRQEEQMRKRLVNDETLVTQGAVLPAVTELHLQHNFTCLATNNVGNTSATTRLQRRDTAGRGLAGALGPVVCVVLLTVLAVMVYVHRLELTLIYRSYWQSNNHGGGHKKDIDVFLSHAWSRSPRDTAALSSRPGSPPSSQPCVPLEELLRWVLEASGYRLFLPERDLLPGGAYTEDVVRVLQRSRCLACLLSSDFLSNSSTVFVLEAGVQALLRDPHLKVLVIWTEPRPPMSQLDPPLPRLVHRALRVLPDLDWRPGLPPDSSRTFWKSLWKALSRHSRVPLTQSSDNLF